MSLMTFPHPAPIAAERVRTLHLPRLDAAATARARRLATPRRPLPLPGNETFSLVVLEHPPAIPRPLDERLAVGFRYGEDEIVATLPANLLAGPVRSLDPALRLEPLPPADLFALLTEAALMPLIEVLERGTGVPVRIDAVTPEPDPTAAAGATTLPIALRGPGLDHTLLLSGAADALDRLIQSWPVAPRAMDALRIGLRLQAGATELPLAVTHSLRPGDGILIQHAATSPMTAGTTSVLHLVVADTLGVPVALSALRDGTAEVTLLGPLRPIIASTSHSPAGRRVTQNQAPSPSLSPTGDPIDDIPIRLVFEAGRLELSLGELRQLGAGSVLPFSAAASGHTPGVVQILAGTHRLGLGELVDIDGHPGVRIISFAPDIDGGATASAQEPNGAA